MINYQKHLFQNGNGEVILDITSEDVEFFPLVDYRAKDFGKKPQRHGYTLGKVCFSG